MKRKDGETRSDYDFELDVLILNLIQEFHQGNAFFIKKILNERYCRKLGWNTIKRHLEYLLNKQEIKIIYETEEGKKKIRLFSINNR